MRIGKPDIAQAALKYSSWSYAMSYCTVMPIAVRTPTRTTATLSLLWRRNLSRLRCVILYRTRVRQICLMSRVIAIYLCSQLLWYSMLGHGQRLQAVTHTRLLITSGRALPTLSSQADGGCLLLSIMLSHAYYIVSRQAEIFLTCLSS